MIVTPISICRKLSLAQLSGETVFSKVDTNSGFWQIPLAEESQQLTKCTILHGRYCFRNYHLASLVHQNYLFSQSYHSGIVEFKENSFISITLAVGHRNNKLKEALAVTCLWQVLLLHTGQTIHDRWLTPSHCYNTEHKAPWQPTSPSTSLSYQACSVQLFYHPCTLQTVVPCIHNLASSSVNTGSGSMPFVTKTIPVIDWQLDVFIGKLRNLRTKSRLWSVEFVPKLQFGGRRLVLGGIPVFTVISVSGFTVSVFPQNRYPLTWCWTNRSTRWVS